MDNSEVNTSRNDKKDVCIQPFTQPTEAITHNEISPQSNKNGGIVIKKCVVHYYKLPEVQFVSKPVQSDCNEKVKNELQPVNLRREVTIDTEVSQKNNQNEQDLESELQPINNLTRVIVNNKILQQSNGEAKCNLKDTLGSLVSWKKICLILLSTGAYIFDVGSDVCLAVSYYSKEEYLYCSLTALFVYLPVLAQVLIIIIWSSKEGRIHYVLVLLAIVLMVPVAGMLGQLYYIVKYYRAKRNEDIRGMREYLKEVEDGEFANKVLKMMESVGECAPQVILQLTIILSTKSINGLQIFSIVTSFLAMTQTSVTYLSGKENWITGLQGTDGLLDQIKKFFSFLFMIMPRILSITLFASVSTVAAVLGCTVHIILMTLLQVLYDYVHSKMTLDRVLYEFMIGVSSVPNPDILVDSDNFPFNSMIKYFTYHAICFVENVLAVTVWAVMSYHTDSQSWYYVPVIVFSTVPYIIVAITNYTFNRK